MAFQSRRLTSGLLAAVVLVLIIGSGAAIAISRHEHDVANSSAAPRPAAAGAGVSTGGGSTTASERSGTDRTSVPTPRSPSRSAVQPAAAPSDPTVAPAGPSSNMTVQISPSVRAHPRSSQIQQLLQNYFDAINQHNYDSWTQLVSTVMAGRQNSQQWLDAYATTVDSSIWMQSMTDDPLQVKLRFTSQQDPDLAPKDLPVDCINWTLTYQFASENGGIVVGSTVPGSVSTAKCT